MIKKIIFSVIFILGLIYIVWPGPSSISDIPPVPNSLKSDELGDTVQNADLSAYFSDYRRKEVTSFYKNKFSYLNIFGVKIPPMAFNHPVEVAQTAVKDQIRTSYVEEYTYPLRDSLFVNGYDLDVWNSLNHIKNDGINDKIVVGDKTFNSKTTIKYYGSNTALRVLIYLALWIAGFFAIKVFLKAIRKY